MAFRKVNHRGLNLFTTQKRLKALSSYFDDADVVFVMTNEKIIPDNLTMVDVPPEASNFGIFKDEYDYYITNFLFDQTVLDQPLKLIAVFKGQVKLVVGQKMISFLKIDLHEKLNSETFYYDVFEITESMATVNNRKPRKRLFDESLDVCETSSCSQELGVRTRSASPSQISYCSESSNSLVDISLQDIAARTAEVVEDEVTNDVRSIVPIKISKLDKKLNKKLKLDAIKNKVDTLISSTVIKQEEITIPLDKIILPADFPSSDTVIDRMKSELDKFSSLQDKDPVIVVKQEGEYVVLSGKKRVAAYKANSKSRMMVKEICGEDYEKFKLNQYFRNEASNESEVLEIMKIIERLLNYLGIDGALLSTWTTVEQNYAFESLFGEKSTPKMLLEAFSYPELVKALYSYMTTRKIRIIACRDVIRKYRQNPKAIISLLQSEDDALAQKLVHVKPDISYTLNRKKIDKEIADFCAHEYENDDDFLQFIKSSDLRFMNTHSTRQSLIKKFEAFKSKKTGTSGLKLVSDLPSDFSGIAITNDEKFAMKVLNQQLSVVVFTLSNEGDSLNPMSHMFVIPEIMCAKDKNHQLQNYGIVKIQVKSNGILLNGKEKSEYFENHGTYNKIVLSLEEIQLVSKSFNSCFIDSTVKDNELILSLVHETATIIVSDKKQYEEIQNLMKIARVPKNPSIRPSDLVNDENK